MIITIADPCEDVSCGPNAHCMILNDIATCLCSNGFTGKPGVKSGCTDIDECAVNPCPPGAVCNNEAGSFSCQCPSGTTGDPYNGGCKESAVPHVCGPNSPCPAGEQCVKDEFVGSNVCICQQRYTRDPETGKCRDVNECLEHRDKPPCGVNAICKNLPGSYDCQCLPGFHGNPFTLCEECNSIECQCQPPYKIVNDKCMLAGCSGGEPCPKGAECITIAGGVSYCACPKGYSTQPDGSCEDINECTEGRQVCGYGAECINRPGSYECVCPHGYGGDPYNGLCSPAQKRCTSDNECKANEKCVQPGECVCPPPFYTDALDGNHCKNPCDRFPCGMNAKCTPSDPPRCMCETGYEGDPQHGCVDVNECINNPCGHGAYCLNNRGGHICECPKGSVGDPYGSGCTGGIQPRQECSSNNDCENYLACVQGSCVNPCDNVPCGPNAYCEPDKHVPWCRCVVGFTEGSNNECVSQCDGFVCGAGAQCIVSYDGPTCKCIEGFMGNPFPGGQCVPDVCSPEVPCAEPSVCIGGRCKRRCEGVVCGIGASCDPQTNKCVCNPYFVGNPDLLCMPPIEPPRCEPSCGDNAHCEYDVAGFKCVCNPGTTGNPYQGCGAQKKSECTNSICGKDANCHAGPNAIECVCPPGFAGNPYIQCHDINECSGNACGSNAVCLNTLGSYDCRCKEGFFGNPFVGCLAIESGPCTDPATCRCSNEVPCPYSHTCVEGSCVNKCSNTQCGPKADCQDGNCICPSGYIGNPHDLVKGCHLKAHCSNDLDCESQQICFQVGKGVRKCVDACSKLQCGPNALCVTQNHVSSCICIDGYFGNPSNLVDGCQPDRSIAPPVCSSDSDCAEGYFCILLDNGIHDCINPCSKVVCGAYQHCEPDGSGHATCKCQDGYEWNPVTSNCEKPSVPDCIADSDCHSTEACRPDALGVLKCISSCKSFTCPLNSQCVANNHQAACECLLGFAGNPNDRQGCQSARQNRCSTDSECSEDQTCKTSNDGALLCLPVCDFVTCGPGAICVVNNHVANCECPPGLYAGDPNGANGCKPVPCVYNIDCPPTQLCDRLSHTCHDVCEENACGTNAVCIANDHRAVCQCPPGFKANPVADVECVGVEACNPNPCHPTAICVVGAADSPVCQCQPGQVGDPYGSGCQPEGSCVSNKDCPKQSVCQNHRCINPCEDACGKNAICEIINGEPICRCVNRFVPSVEGPQNGCVRGTNYCLTSADCDDGNCLDGQCRAVCRSTDDCAQGEKCINSVCSVPCVTPSQCQADQTCYNGACILGCRSSKSCPSDQSCINNRCQNPCSLKENVCGANAICNCIDHATSCSCPAGFSGNPTPQQGCVRVPNICHSNQDCPAQHFCDKGFCQCSCSSKNDCAQGERCKNGYCAKVCYGNGNCLPGELCVDGSCEIGCTSDTGCRADEVCINGKCKCSHGFIAGPDTCLDINECEEHPCHPSAECINLHGTYKCVCPQGTAGDPVGTGCLTPHQCENHHDCPDSQSCIHFSCADPCSLVDCGPNTICSVIDHVAGCQCQSGYIGDASGCFKVECLTDNECPKDKYCNLESNKCASPCNRVNCGYGICIAVKHNAVCQCHPGYGLIGDTCLDVDECLDHPCHSTAVCQNTEGSFYCSCPHGLVGDPIGLGCKLPGDCFADNDCPNSASCIDNTCRNPCDIPNTCGHNAECLVRNHIPECRCAGQSSGNPKIECIRFECNYHSDCGPSHACFDNKCVDPCSVPNVCGQGADCSSLNHSAVCTCQPGGTGDPNLGCTPVQYCKTDSQCPTGASCNGGICTALCTSIRDCIGDQLCIDGLCRPTCKSNSTCPEYQYCQNNICVQELRCTSDNDCGYDEKCIRNNLGQAECRQACELILCGRNAGCKSDNHKATCACDRGFFGDAYDDKMGCQPIECESHNDCSDEKICDLHKCRIACLAHNPCGQNAICSTNNHQQVCTCQPGYTGEPTRGCDLIDFCLNSPCAPGAVCTNSRGSYRCHCQLGTVGDAYNSGCQTPVECLRDQDCPITARCIEINGVPKCADVCSRVRCGPNAECIPGEHVASCSCRLGYDGDANDLRVGCRPLPTACSTSSECPANTYCYENICRPSCQSDEECNLTDRCLNGQCLDPCEVRTACGINADCQVNNHIKRCSCPPGFTGNSEVECVRLPVSCNGDEDCSLGNTCRDNVCLPTCTSDNQCAFNEKCVRGNCLLTCRLDNDCFLGHICLNNMCSYGCRGDEDCNANEACASNKCVNPCDVTPCGPNANCIATNQRASCACPDGFMPNPSARIACLRAPGPSCQANRDCPLGAACVAGSCVAVCSSNANCLSNERCDSSGICRALCRQDEDCRSGEICEGLVCLAGCRAEIECAENLSCINNQCVDPCSLPDCCGTNANCAMLNHQKQCSCPAPLVGDPLTGCRRNFIPCSDSCPPGHTCNGGSCYATCRSDSNCLNDERCETGVCKAICNTDDHCSPGQICENRICELGCRSDNACSNDESCINNKCQSPCEGGKACGECAGCRVVNHAAQCSCPPNYYGNALISCTKSPVPCDGVCECDEIGYCVRSCSVNENCACGEVCDHGKCRIKCDANNSCKKGYICNSGLCLAGCRTHSDCPTSLSCNNGQCEDPCLYNGSPCGINALCKVSGHRAVCLCPEGYQGEPSQECYQLECLRHEDCEPTKRCSDDGVCTNPCLQHGVCGFNAQCRVVDRTAQCSCPPGHYGNPKINCKPGTDECLRRPCGVNAKCRETAGGFECSCAPGCYGDPHQVCICDDDLCRDTSCGVKAACRVYNNQPQCYCPPEYPAGDPMHECKLRFFFFKVVW